METTEHSEPLGQDAPVGARCRRSRAALAVTVMALLVGSGCQVARAGARCTGGFGRDSSHVLTCIKGRWVRTMTTGDYLRLVAPPAAANAAPSSFAVPTTADPVPANGPYIASFDVVSVQKTPGGSVGRVSWRIANSDGLPMRCQFNLDGHSYTIQVDPCPATGSQVVSIPDSDVLCSCGLRAAGMRVDDGVNPPVEQYACFTPAS